MFDFLLDIANLIQLDEMTTIGIVGPCASGKTTLKKGLSKFGFQCRHIAQEHSYVADMWQRMTNPDILIYLDVSFPRTIERRNLTWSEDDYLEQIYRLRHARKFADIYIHTDSLTSDEVLSHSLSLIKKTTTGEIK